MNIFKYIARHIKNVLCWSGALLLCACNAVADYSDRAEVQAFIDTMVKEHQFDAHDLNALFSKVHKQDKVLTLMEKPAEKKPWYQYKPLFISDARIKDGVAFWEQHRDALEQAQKKYGVPPEVIIAIIGVETRYGDNVGSFPVFDTLTTLAFDYPKRSPFFTKELQEYLLLTREEEFDPRRLRGSYAGAMGMPQFMPSSYRHYAIDFSGQGQRDLFHNVPDVIGSVANYFSEHGWQAGGPIVMPAAVTGNKYQGLTINSIDVPNTPVSKLAQYGIKPSSHITPQTPATLLVLETKNNPEFWLGFKNFYVITRYNRSVLYVMAVYTLSEEIKKAKK